MTHGSLLLAQNMLLVLFVVLPYYLTHDQGCHFCLAKTTLYLFYSTNIELNSGYVINASFEQFFTSNSCSVSHIHHLLRV